MASNGPFRHSVPSGFITLYLGRPRYAFTLASTGQSPWKVIHWQHPDEICIPTFNIRSEQYITFTTNTITGVSARAHGRKRLLIHDWPPNLRIPERTTDKPQWLMAHVGNWNSV